MKKLSLIFAPVALIITVLSLNGCSEELPYKGGTVTPIVMSLLDKSDSVHYVKLTRSFAGNNNALEVALIEDSSYYDNVEVKIEEYTPINANGGLQLRRTWILEDTVLTTKEPGAFYAPNQKVYYFKTEVYDAGNPPNDGDVNLNVALKPNATYKLVATVNNGEYVINAETQLVNDMSINYPLSLGQYTFANYSGNAFTSYATTNCRAEIGTMANSAKVVDIRLKITIREYFSGVPVPKTFFYKLGELNGTDITESEVKLIAQGSSFYNVIAQNVTNDPTIDKRQLQSIELIFTGGNEDLSKYILVSQPTTGLAQNKPTYTNVSCSDGRQALGIFASRNRTSQLKVEGTNSRALNKNSMRQLCTGAITGALLFCSENAADSPEVYFCN